ncbi:MAG: toast rack family protein [Candidatus Promineifilaceae bacterium]
MTRQKFTFAALLAIVVVLFAATGCIEGARVGDLQTKSETVELGDAESVSVDIDMGAGELDVSGGAGELLEATFTYNVEELNPEATYSNGNLVVKHDDVKEGIGTFFDLDDYRNEWDLRFKEGVPMEMNINVGAGRSKLSLGSLALSRLDINAGAGEVDLDLSDSQSLNRLDFDMGAGGLTLDLTGEWQDDLNAAIKGGVGEINLKLPSNSGVRIVVNTGIGDVDTSGLMKDGDTYTNDAYGESEVTLRIDIDGGIGQINLDVA